MRAAAALAPLLLAGCFATTDPPVVVRPVEVTVPVPVPCTPALPERTPEAPAAGGREQYAAAALAERRRLRAERDQLRAALIACGKGGAP